MSLIGVCGLCLVLVFLVKVLEKQNGSFSVGLVVLGAGLVLAVSLGRILPILDELQALVQEDETLSQYLTVAMKGLGVCYLSGFASSICRDSGESSLSNFIELIAKITLVGMYLPLLLELLNNTVSWIGG